ncbi:MAG: hypothetical protein K9N51_11860 [Candidatus Pacebacteria bacterium]|nr:hypothetical protein [Candidatus Paceibacterota bacterium]
MPLLAEHGFNAVDFKVHPFVDEKMDRLIPEVAAATADAGLDLYIYLYDRGRRRDAVTNADLPAVVNTEGAVNHQMFCPYTPQVWLECFGHAFQVAEVSMKVPVAGVKIDIEHLLQFQKPCVCDACFYSYIANLESQDKVDVDWSTEIIALEDRWDWIQKHGGKTAYMAHLESRVDAAAKAFERRMHKINPDLRLGMMPVGDAPLKRPWIRHLATERAPAIMDSWAMYGGHGWTDGVARLRNFIKSLNPHNLFVPWFRGNNYRPDDIGSHAFVAAVQADGYNIWQLNMFDPKQRAARIQTYALPDDYKDPFAYWRALGNANQRVATWLRNPSDISFTPIDRMLERIDISDVSIPELRPVNMMLEKPATPLDAPAPTGLRGINKAYIYVNDPAEPIKLEIRHTANRDRPIHWVVAQAPEQAVAEGQVPPGETSTFSVKVERAGIYALIMQAKLGGGPWYSLRVLSPHPYGIDASGEAYFFRGSPRQYFWVPETLKTFRVRASTGTINQEMRVQVWRPDGSEALDHVVNSDIAKSETLEVSVPKQSAGAIWSLHVGGPEKLKAGHYTENYYLKIMDASPFLADSPDKVVTDKNLVPE